MPRFPVESVVPRIVDWLEDFAEGVPGVEPFADGLDRSDRLRFNTRPRNGLGMTGRYVEGRTPEYPAP